MSANRNNYLHIKHRRAQFPGNCGDGLQHGLVDFQNRWEENPHWHPGAKGQPLHMGHYDFDEDNRRLNENNGKLFQQYSNTWIGEGNLTRPLKNNIKNRSDLLNKGHLSDLRRLENAYHPRLGKRGFVNTEIAYEQPDPYGEPLYGGYAVFGRNNLNH